MAAKDGQRRTKFMAGIIEELALRGERGFELVQHLIECALEFGKVVVAGDFDSETQIAVRNGVRGFTEHAHWSEQAARHQRRHEGDDQPRQGGHNRIGSQQPVHLDVGFGKVVDHHEGGISVSVADGKYGNPIAIVSIINFDRAANVPQRVDGFDEYIRTLQWVFVSALGEGFALHREPVHDFVAFGQVAIEKQLEQRVRTAERSCGCRVDPAILQFAELRDLLGLFAIDGAIHILPLDHVKREAHRDQRYCREQGDD